MARATIIQETYVVSFIAVLSFCLSTVSTSKLIFKLNFHAFESKMTSIFL